MSLSIKELKPFLSYNSKGQAIFYQYPQADTQNVYNQFFKQKGTRDGKIATAAGSNIHAEYQTKPISILENILSTAVKNESHK